MKPYARRQSCLESISSSAMRTLDGTMSAADSSRLLLFLSLFFTAVGCLFTLLCCGCDYWLLAAETCSLTQGVVGEALSGGMDVRTDFDTEVLADGRVFHQGLLWRCWFPAGSCNFSTWDLWIPNQPPSKRCHVAFLFPFPASRVINGRSLAPEMYEGNSAIVFRTFWGIFLVVGLTAVTAGGFVAVCAGPLASRRLFTMGGALQLCGGVCLLLVLLMYLLWVHVLDTLDQWAHQRQLTGCPSFRLHVRLGPSFLLAPVAVFFWLLAGGMWLAVGQGSKGRGLGVKTSSASSV